MNNADIDCGWEVKKLKDICSKINYGITASATQENTGYKFLRITDIVPDLINWDLVPFCKITDEEFKKYKLDKDDIVIARTGATTGYAKYIKNDVNAVFASYLIRIKIDQNNDAKFISKIVESGIYKKFIQSQLTGSAQPQANAQILTSFQLSLPPKIIQSKIASIISAYDDLIEANEKRIKILEEMAQRLYTEWFVKFRFPGYEKVRMVDSGTEFGLIPDQWDACPLTQLADVNAKTIKSKTPSENISYVDISAVTRGKIDEIKIMQFVNAPSRARRVAVHGDIIWSTVRPNRKSYALILNPVNNLIVSTGFAVITATTAPYTYLYHAITTNNFVTYLISNARGAAYPAVTSIDFERASILRPSKTLLDRFHLLTSAWYEQKDLLLNINSKLKLGRDLLISQLINGNRELK